jgi:hypothetical protein
MLAPLVLKRKSYDIQQLLNDRARDRVRDGRQVDLRKLHITSTSVDYQWMADRFSPRNYGEDTSMV